MEGIEWTPWAVLEGVIPTTHWPNLDEIGSDHPTMNANTGDLKQRLFWRMVASWRGAAQDSAKVVVVR